jgi:hypothetical protein
VFQKKIELLKCFSEFNQILLQQDYMRALSRVQQNTKIIHFCSFDELAKEVYAKVFARTVVFMFVHAKFVRHASSASASQTSILGSQSASVSDRTWFKRTTLIYSCNFRRTARAYSINSADEKFLEYREL